MDNTVKPERVIMGDGINRITLTPDESYLSLLMHNGWDYIQIASSTRMEDGIWLTKSVYTEPTCHTTHEVKDALWALRTTIPDEEPQDTIDHWPAFTEDYLVPA